MARVKKKPKRVRHPGPRGRVEFPLPLKKQTSKWPPEWQYLAKSRKLGHAFGTRQYMPKIAKGARKHVFNRDRIFSQAYSVPKIIPKLSPDDNAYQSSKYRPKPPNYTPPLTHTPMLSECAYYKNK